MRALSGELLRLLVRLGDALPFSLLEWGACALTAALLALFVHKARARSPRRALRALFTRLLAVFCALLGLFMFSWFPLYFDDAQAAPITASARQLSASCEALIEALNAAALDFDALDAPLPAKRAAFPFWMRAFGISGFFSCFTGEALISPEVPDCAAPFVAVHERMHAQGIAAEGAANIAAYERCLERGGAWADSARLWALSYSMNALADLDAGAWRACLSMMRADTLRCANQIGLRRPAEALPASMGVSSADFGGAARNYEILAVYLAAAMPV